jgi:hypothetical protein
MVFRNLAPLALWLYRHYESLPLINQAGIVKLFLKTMACRYWHCQALPQIQPLVYLKF